MPVSAIIRCHEDERITRCIESLGNNAGNHEIVAVLTETSHGIHNLLSGTGVVIAQAPVGNLSLSTNIGIDAASNDRFMVLDADVRCSEGCLDIVDRDLDNHLLVRTEMNFESNTFLQRLVADLRHYIYSQDLFYCPGAAFRGELKNKIGGHFYNDKVWWTEDAEMNHRIKKANIPIYRERRAVVTHDAESVCHDLKGAYKIGRGKYSQVLHAGRDTYEEHIINTAKRLLSGHSIAELVKIAREKSPSVAAYSVIWQVLYYLGYYRERFCSTAKLSSENRTIC